MSAPTIELTAEPAITLRTGRIAIAALVSLSAAVVTVALSIGAFRFGIETASAGIYERQNAKLEAQVSGLMRLVGVVDQTKAREFSSCVQSGRPDCESVIAPVIP